MFSSVFGPFWSNLLEFRWFSVNSDPICSRLRPGFNWAVGFCAYVKLEWHKFEQILTQKKTKTDQNAEFLYNKKKWSSFFLGIKRSSRILDEIFVQILDENWWKAMETVVACSSPHSKKVSFSQSFDTANIDLGRENDEDHYTYCYWRPDSGDFAEWPPVCMQIRAKSTQFGMELAKIRAKFISQNWPENGRDQMSTAFFWDQFCAISAPNRLFGECKRNMKPVSPPLRGLPLEFAPEKLAELR